MKKPYKVLIVVKDQWWSDNREWATLAAAKRHQRTLAERWNDCDTAICAPDNRVLNFKESKLAMAALSNV